MPPKKFDKDIPLFIPRSTTSSAENKTGSWRYFRPLYEEKTAPCSAACPVGEDIPRIEMLARQGSFKKAGEIILQENPFPAICGRVCFHPCEGACNRGDYDQPIAIHYLERFIGDTILMQGTAPDLRPASTNGKKVAIAGAGPAGLSTAYFLSRLGYRSDVFEAQPEPGGLLRWGIPDYRLPQDVLSREISRIENCGASIQYNTPVTQERLDKMMGRYDAVFIGCGYDRPIQINIPGEQWAQDGLKLLHRVGNGESVTIQGTAAVVGGGNTAIDVARTLKRLGADPIIVYRRRKCDMPAFAPEIAMALEEYIELKELVAPIAIHKKDNPTAAPDSGYALTLQKMKVSETPIRGRARVVPDGEHCETLSVDHVFMAIGAGPQPIWNPPAPTQISELKLSHCRIMKREVPLIFGGDLSNQIQSVTDAIASGKQGAMALDVYFNHGWDAIEERLAGCRVADGPALSMAAYLNAERKDGKVHVVSFAEINCDYFQSNPRTVPTRLAAHQRIRSFTEIESTLVKDAAVQEAERCFNCGICTSCDYCRIFCPDVAVIVEKAGRHINLDYCKGCGICVTECPRNAMALEEEKR